MKQKIESTRPAEYYFEIMKKKAEDLYSIILDGFIDVLELHGVTEMEIPTDLTMSVADKCIGGDENNNNKWQPKEAKEKPKKLKLRMTQKKLDKIQNGLCDDCLGFGERLKFERCKTCEFNLKNYVKGNR